MAGGGIYNTAEPTQMGKEGVAIGPMGPPITPMNPFEQPLVPFSSPTPPMASWAQPGSPYGGSFMSPPPQAQGPMGTGLGMGPGTAGFDQPGGPMMAQGQMGGGGAMPQQGTQMPMGAAPIQGQGLLPQQVSGTPQGPPPSPGPQPAPSQGSKSTASPLQRLQAFLRAQDPRAIAMMGAVIGEGFSNPEAAIQMAQNFAAARDAREFKYRELEEQGRVRQLEMQGRQQNRFDERKAVTLRRLAAVGKLEDYERLYGSIDDDADVQRAEGIISEANAEKAADKKRMQLYALVIRTGGNVDLKQFGLENDNTAKLIAEHAKNLADIFKNRADAAKRLMEAKIKQIKGAGTRTSMSSKLTAIKMRHQVLNQELQGIKRKLLSFDTGERMDLYNNRGELEDRVDEIDMEMQLLEKRADRITNGEDAPVNDLENLPYVGESSEETEPPLRPASTLPEAVDREVKPPFKGKVKSAALADAMGIQPDETPEPVKSHESVLDFE